MMSGDYPLDVREGLGLDLCVLLDVVFKWVLEERECSLWPIKGRDVELVDGLRARRGPYSRWWLG